MARAEIPFLTLIQSMKSFENLKKFSHLNSNLFANRFVRWNILKISRLHCLDGVLRKIIFIARMLTVRKQSQSKIGKKSYERK